MQVPEAATREDPETLSEEAARRWLLPSLYERLRTGSSEFLTELRPAYPLFARFGGIDYDDDDDAPAKLDAFLRHVQRILTAYGGNLVHLSVGDKGAYLYGVFGSPYAHEDDAARASAAALELRELPKITAITTLQIGITYGRLRSGHVRPRAPAGVHVPRGCRQSRRATHEPGTAGRDLRLRRGPRFRPRPVRVERARADSGKGQARACASLCVDGIGQARPPERSRRTRRYR